MVKYGLELRAWELISYCILFVVGVIGNSIVCVVVMKSRSSSGRMRDVPFNVYLMSLAIADMALAVVCLPVYLLSTTIFPHPTGIKGTILCKLFTGYLLPFCFGSVSVYTLVIISFERYTAISKPFVAMTKRVSKVTALYIGSAWLIGLVLQLPTIVGVEYHPSTGRYCDYRWNKTTETLAYAAAFTFQYLVPAAIFVVNFYRIQRCLTKIDKTLKSNLKNGGQFVSIMKVKKKTVRIVFVVSAAFFICWTPNAIMYFLFKYAGSHSSWKTDIYRVSMILAFYNSCINPFLYAFQSKEFQGHCKKVFRQMFQNRKQTGEPRSSSSSSNQTNVRFKRLVELKASH